MWDLRVRTTTWAMDLNMNTKLVFGWKRAGRPAGLHVVFGQASLGRLSESVFSCNLLSQEGRRGKQGDCAGKAGLLLATVSDPSEPCGVHLRVGIWVSGKK